MILSRLKTPALALVAAGILAAGGVDDPPGRGSCPRARAGHGSPHRRRTGRLARPSAPGSLLQFHFVADSSRDADAIARALKSDLEKPPEGYRWFRLSRLLRRHRPRRHDDPQGPDRRAPSGSSSSSTRRT